MRLVVVALLGLDARPRSLFRVLGLVTVFLCLVL